MLEVDKIKAETSRIRAEVKKQTVGYILAAFGLVAGLAWNDAIKALIQHFFPQDKNSITAQFIYAAIITIAVVILGIYLAKLAGRSEDQK